MSEKQLIGDADLDPQAAQAAEEVRDIAAVSRRPSGLVSQPEIERLSRRTNGAGMAYFLVHYALIAAGAWLVLRSFDSVAFWPIFALHAFVVGFLFSPLHECAHGAAFRTRWLNEAVLWVTAFGYIVPPYYFRYFHLGHHRYTQVPGKDPSLVLPEPARFSQYLWYCAGLWFWWRNLSWMVKHAVGLTHPMSTSYVPKSRRGLMVLEARVLCLAYVCLGTAAVYYGFALELVICWLGPRFVGEPIQRVMRVAEHVGCEESPDLLANTRTTLTNPVINALAWQMPYHAEHHLFPNVPFHRLRALHGIVGGQVTVEPGGYVAGQWRIIKQLWAGTQADEKRPRAPSPLL